MLPKGKCSHQVHRQVHHNKKGPVILKDNRAFSKKKFLVELEGIEPTTS